MKEFNFTQPFAMRCDAEQFESVKNELEGMGYKSNNFDNFECESITYLHLWTFAGKSLYTDANKISGVPHIETFNRPLCLALAAMTDKPDGIVGEWWVFIGESYKNFTFDKIYRQQKDTINQWGVFIDNRGCKNGFAGENKIRFRKATADELIKYFTEEKPFILPEKWYCPYENREQFEVMKKHFKKGSWSYLEPNGMRGCTNDDNACWNNWTSQFNYEKYTKITFDQFMKHVVGESKSEPVETETENAATVFNNTAKVESIEASKSDRDYIESLNLWIKKQKLCNELKHADIKHEQKSIKLRKKILKVSIADYEIELSRLADTEVMLSEFKALHNIN